jgi:hypothetical protein
MLCAKNNYQQNTAIVKCNYQLLVFEMEWVMRWIFSKIGSILSVHEQMVLKLKGSLLKRKVNIKFLLVSLKTHSKYGSESRIRIFSLRLTDFRLCFFGIGRFFQCTHQSRLPDPFSWLKAAFCQYSQGKIAAVGLLQRATERTFRISK